MDKKLSRMAYLEFIFLLLGDIWAMYCAELETCLSGRYRAWSSLVQAAAREIWQQCTGLLLKPTLVVLFCLIYNAAFAFLSSNCDPEAASDEEKPNLPKFLSEVHLSSVEGSAESVEVLKKIVKRLAPEKNGEYQLYQGVTGQPGVDFPALTSIPATSFSCRGVKGGYYADLETNCQVFHICDNGRKISFLCPNGTIFQQSQLICDWWFKVDCSKSVELYEQSSEQLADEERKRAEARKLKLDIQRTIEKGNSHDYYDVQSLNYDGTQNGRISPYDEPQKQPQVQINRERVKSSQYVDSNNLFGQDPASLRDSNRFFTKTNQQVNSKTSQSSPNTSSKPQYNQYNDYDDGNANKYSTTSQDYYGTSKKAQNYHGTNRNSNTPRDEKVLLKRLKYKNAPRSNMTSSSSPAPKITPMYMESTTFRASSVSPIKESQQFAESAAFVSNRGNRYNENVGNPHQFYYQLYTNRDSAADEPDRSPVDSASRQDGQDGATTRDDYESYTDSPHSTDYERKSETTMMPQETTLQYAVTTMKPPCDSGRSRTEHVTPDPPSTHDFQQLTESPYPFYNTNNDYQESFENTAEPRNTYPDTTYYRSAENTNENAVTGEDGTPSTSGSATTRTYITTESYRHHMGTTQNAGETARQRYTANTVTSPPTTYYDSTVTRNQESTVTQTVPSTRYNAEARTDSRAMGRNPQAASQIYRQESTSASTEKPFRSTLGYQQNASTEKDISPYDTSFTYKQGKVMSTLGPYIPFTRNYAFSASSITTTPKPTTYAPTVPTIITTPSPTTIPTTMPTTIPVSTSTAPPYYNSPSVHPYSPAKSLIPKLKHGLVPTSNRIRANSQYLQKEKEHALNMLHSLQGIEKKVLGLTDTPNVTNRGRSDSPASGPSTLHSLALYFSTATENFDSRETTDSAIGRKHRPEKKSWSPPRKNSTTVEVPTSILTQHTISSYAELFKLNNAVESNNGTTEDRFDSTYGEEYSDDLDIQQSGGLVNDNKNGTDSNGTKLRELAQVFTHALSAYLQDPGNFKKALTEIRPTEPAQTTTDSEQWKTTTPYPTFEDEYTSNVREKDEVLDFSDDDNELARQKLTTAYPSTVQQTTVTPDFNYNDFTTRPTNYYTTPAMQYDSSARFTTASSTVNSYYETSTPATVNTYSFNEAQDYDVGSSNDVSDGNNDVSEANYFSSEEVSSRNRVGGFQNNSAISSPYGKIKLYPGSAGNDNYVASSTPPTRSQFGHSTAYNWNRSPTSRKPEQQLTPPFHDSYGRGNNRVVPDAFSFEAFSTPIPTHKIRSTTVFPARNFENPKNEQSYKIHFYNPPNPARGPGESLATAPTSYIKFRNYNRVDVNAESTERPTTTTIVIPTRPTDPVTMAATETDTTPYVSTTFDDSSETNSEKNPITIKYPKALTNDHWTSSPAVTRLWETSVFVDPKRINHGLEESDSTTTLPTTTVEPTIVTERLERSSTPSLREENFGTPSAAIDPITNEPDVSPPWQWLSRDKDSPTAFTLLPTAFSIENTVTPKPVITTRSSITTTITSSVTSTNAIPQENFVSSLLPYTLSANKVNETEVAEKLFGKLNATSTNTLIRVMKQADNNETVRQLVLLLISNCKEPTNRTSEREREQLINALLRMPVNEFTSHESRNVVAGINKLNTPTVRSRFVPSTNSTARTRSTSTSSTLTEPPVTTYRNRKTRRFRTTTEDSANLVRRSDKPLATETNNSLTEDETSASDNRALELLRSLYMIATKWG